MSIDSVYFQGEDALSNQFTIEIPDFPGYTGATNIKFRVTELTIPETAIATYEVHYGTLKFTRASGKIDTSNEFSFTYRLDKWYHIYEGFEKWLNSVLHPQTGKMGADIANSYRRDIIVKGIDANGNDTNVGWKFVGCFPIRQAAPSFSQDSGDPIMIEVTLQFMKKLFLGSKSPVNITANTLATISGE